MNSIPNVLFLGDGYRSLGVFCLDVLWKFFLITLIEAVAFHWMQKKVVSLWRSIELLAIVNFASAAIGYVILLLSPPWRMIYFAIPNIYIPTVIDYILAFLQSWLFEYLIFRLIRRDLQVRNLGMSIAYVNMASYVIMFVILFILHIMITP